MLTDWTSGCDTDSLPCCHMTALAGVTNYDFIDAADYRNASSYTEAEFHK